MVLYAIVVLRGYGLAAVTRNGFASLMAVGLVSAFFYHVMVNVLMTIGWAPVTGLPLPLLSYGGTALIVNAVQLGLLQNVALRRQSTDVGHSEIAHWGPLHIRSYGLMLAAAIGTWLALREARRLHLDEDKVTSVILVVLVSSVLGARMLYVSSTSTSSAATGAACSRCGRAGSRSMAAWSPAPSPACSPRGAGVADVDAGRRGGPGLRARHRARTGRLLPQRLLLRPADTEAAVGVHFRPIRRSRVRRRRGASFAALLRARLTVFAIAMALRTRLAVPGTLFWIVVRDRPGPHPVVGRA